MRINVIFHSLYGHVYRLSEAVAEGAREVEAAQTRIIQVRETLSDEIIAKMGATEAKKKFAHIPVASLSDLSEPDAVVFGTPTRFGNMSAQMRAFLDSTGGQESTILSFHITLLHHGMIIVGLPYSEARQMTMKEISGGSPYGASTIAGTEGERMPSDNELAMARFQGRHVATITSALVKGRS